MTGSVEDSPSLVKYSFKVGAPPFPVSAPMEPKTKRAPYLLKFSKALKTALRRRKNFAPGAQENTRMANANCSPSPQTTTRQGNFLRSSDSVQARKIKKKMPRNEIRFCIAAALYLRYGTGNALNHFGGEFRVDRQG